MNFLNLCFLVLCVSFLDRGVHFVHSLRSLKNLGEDVSFRCGKTNRSTDISWVKSLMEGENNLISKGDKLVPELANNNRFNVTGTPSSGYELSIKNLTAADVGNYTCLEKDSSGTLEEINELIILAPPAIVAWRNVTDVNDPINLAPDSLITYDTRAASRSAPIELECGAESYKNIASMLFFIGDRHVSDIESDSHAEIVCNNVLGCPKAAYFNMTTSSDRFITEDNGNLITCVANQLDAHAPFRPQQQGNVTLKLEVLFDPERPSVSPPGNAAVALKLGTKDYTMKASYHMNPVPRDCNTISWKYVRSLNPGDHSANITSNNDYNVTNKVVGDEVTSELKVTEFKDTMVGYYRAIGCNDFKIGEIQLKASAVGLSCAVTVTMWSFLASVLVTIG
ncbi:uncharacterized protein LOC141910188 [Tubulanus polymorphus]|uniref:uncharacterized protein LOC141910188 n=1 Tax=Tubulanus polymorphus TaxID=672921 RepID=UPI003DA3F2DB